MVPVPASLAELNMDMTGVQLELTRPHMLLGLLLLPALLYLFLISLVDHGRMQRVLSLSVRSLIVVLLVLALAGLTWMAPTTRQYVVFVVDDSLSVGEAASNAASEFIKRATSQAGSHEVRYIRFASRPDKLTSDPPPTTTTTTSGATVESEAVETGPIETGPVEAVSEEAGDAQRRAYQLGSNLAAAIELAAASMPPFYVKQIVLLSDGNETEGDAERAALTAGAPISTVPLPPRPEPEVQVSAVNVPAQVREGEPFYVEVVVDSNHDDKGFVELYRGPHRVGEHAGPQSIRKGENRFRFRETGVDQRLLEYTVRIHGFQDNLLDNNSASGLIFTDGKPRVLLIESNQRAARQLVWALKEHNITVEVRTPNAVPRSLSELQTFEAIILANVPATDLSLRQMEVMRTYVQDLGGGLIMLGGDQSFGLGGYYKTTLEEILPVRSDFEKEKEKPSLAIVLIVDKSGSMGGAKMELAKDATKGAVELLGPRDQVGVIAFDGGSTWVSEIHSAADKDYVINRVGGIRASGGTSIYPAMRDALEGLEATVAKLKHVILLSDGRSSPGDFEGITRRMASARITVSTVGVGGDADQNLLESIARLGNGRYYSCDDPRSVPQIFAKETVTASKSAINEEPFLPRVVQMTPVLRDVSMDDAPFLLGFVVTRPKPTSEFILATETGEPLLVWWRYGLGMSVAFTSDAGNRWAAEWIAWPEFGKFWAQVVRHAMRKSESRGVVVDVRRKGREVQVVLDATDASGRFRNAATTGLTLIDPDLATSQHAMKQVAPGRYATRFVTPESGTYHLELSQRERDRQVFRQSRGLVVGYPDELRLKPTNQSLLKSIAKVSGGRFDPRPDEVFDVGGRRARRAQPLWPFLIGAAAVLFLLDVALRRIDLTTIGFAGRRTG